MKKLFILLIIFTSCSPTKPYYVRYQDLNKERFEMFREYVITDVPDTVIIKVY